MTHQERKHALLSPSSAERWLNCNRSARLCVGIEDTPSPHAELGTQAHELAEYKLRTAVGESPPEPQLDSRDAAMDNYCDDYVQYCLEEFGRLDKNKTAVLIVEQKVDYSAYVPEGSGMADCVIIGDSEISVIDFKYGEGLLVEAENNSQLKLYALGCVLQFDCVYDIETVNLHIHQPRRSNVSKWTLTKSELLEWAEHIVKPAAVLAFAGEGTQEPGDWCQWCKIKNTCRVRAERNVEILRFNMRDPNQLELWEIAEIVAIAPQVEKWLKDVGAFALLQAQNGEEIPGMKLIEGRSNRKITDEQGAIQKLTQAGYRDIFKPLELLGITALEGVVGRKKLPDILGDSITKPPGKPKLAPADSDKPDYDHLGTVRRAFGIKTD